MLENRKGWIKIVEAFVAILLVVGVILVVLNGGYLEKEKISSGIYDVEISILREIQRNDTMRETILNTPEEQLPIEWKNFPETIKNKIIERTPSHLECISKICAISDPCGLTEEKEQDVYAEGTVISPTIGTGGEVYRKLNLFCWVG